MQKQESSIKKQDSGYWILETGFKIRNTVTLLRPKTVGDEYFRRFNREN